MKKITTFLFFPKTIGNETRWLCMATYTKNYNKSKNSWKAVWWN